MVKAMDEELLVEEISHHETLLRIQRRNLRTLQIQAARYGPLDVPLHIQGALDEVKVEIARIEHVLHDLHIRLRRFKRK